MTENTNFKSGYSEVNGLRMYYEIYGQGNPLVLIHGGGSTIQTSFGRIIPLLAPKRQIIAVELQAHGRTNDRDADLSFIQDADDVAGLLENLQIVKADILGFSNGGQTAMEIAIRHPQLVNRLILCSVFYSRNGVFPQFWEGFASGRVTFSDMPQAYKDAFLEVNNDPDALMNMFDKSARRMRFFKDWSGEQISAIRAPTLIVCGDRDINSPEHAVEMYRLIPHAQLAIFPGGHGKYIGEITTLEDNRGYTDLILPLLEEFLDGK